MTDKSGLDSFEIAVPAESTEAGIATTISTRRWFEIPRNPQEFLKEAKRCNFSLRADVFFSKRLNGLNIDYLHDVMIAGEFATLVDHEMNCRVALIEEHARFPDFRVLFDNPAEGSVDYESVWADERGRRVSDEYAEFYERKAQWDLRRRQILESGGVDPGEFLELEEYSPVGEEEKAREAIPRVILEKTSKGYPSSTRLVVSNNLGTLTNDEYAKLACVGAKSFREIWILQAPILVRVHPDVQVFGDPNRFPQP